MGRLIEIEWLKLRHYRTFWILIILYFALLGIICSSGRAFLDNFESKNAQFQGVSGMLPIYNFPDIWQNITYVASFFKLFLAFIVIISITNESAYRTIRQNVVDGLSKREFITSKVAFIFLLSLINALFVFVVGLALGFTYSTVTNTKSIFQTIAFIPVHFLEIFTYLVLTLLIGLLFKKSGISIVLLMMYTLIIEPILGVLIPNSLEAVARFLPIRAINNLIPSPFERYLMQGALQNVAWDAALIVAVHLVMYVVLCTVVLEKRDL